MIWFSKSSLNCMSSTRTSNIFTNLERSTNHLNFDEFWNCILLHHDIIKEWEESCSWLQSSRNKFNISGSHCMENFGRNYLWTQFNCLKYFTYFVLNTLSSLFLSSKGSDICKLSILISKCSSSCNGNTTTFNLFSFMCRCTNLLGSNFNRTHVLFTDNLLTSPSSFPCTPLDWRKSSISINT